MKPEVLVWGLLFVVAVGLAIRFFDRTFRRMHSVEGEPTALPGQLAETVVEPRTPTAEVPASGAAAPVTTMTPTPPSAHRAEPAPPPTRADEMPPVVLPRLVVAAATAIATRDRTVIAAPDVEATLSPTAVAVAGTAPSLPLATSASDVAVAIPTTIRWRGTRLRARRIGQEMPPLDQRIRETRSRRLRRRLKARRKLAAMRKAPDKAAPRRIGTGAKGGDAFVSARATTRIVGMPHPAPRVRFAAAR